MQGILDKQSLLNRSTRGQWRLYASHRQELERLIVPSRPGGRICVLGAGNCNDIDLRWLTQAYREVHLVDIDGESLSRAAAFQQVESSPALRLAGGIDLTGLGERLGNWAKSPPNEKEVFACARLAAEAPETVTATIAGSFDTVVSPCVLSQLLTPVRDTIKESHPGFDPLLRALRRRHLRLMHALLAPGGRAVLASDLFSSAVLPELARVEKKELPDLMRKMIARGKFFSGLDPASVARAVQSDPVLNADLAGIETAPPWLWHLGLAKSYLVYALQFQKKGSR